MYERNAIVLERYFENLFGFKLKDNIKQNYQNYRNLIEKYEKYSLATEAENKSTEEFKQISNKIAQLQKNQEVLYNKCAKLEYGRNIIFSNIEEKPEQIENCLLKIEKDIEKDFNELNDLDKKFVSAVIEYNEKKFNMERCIQENKNAKYEFESVLDITKNCYENISGEKIEIAHEFFSSENKNNRKELINIFSENGKNERIPFDIDVISNAVNVSIDIYKIEIENYLIGLDKTMRILEEVENNSVKIAKHKKFYNDSKAKIDFIYAEKEYLIQFLDNERIAAIYNQKVHRKLMLEACRNLKDDLEQINKLYDIILKEIAGRSTKRIYKENYNKEYLINMEQNTVNTDVETPNIRANSVALMNLNYWRIEGIRRIYEVFDKDIVEIYNKDLDELVPEVVLGNIYDEINIENNNDINTKIENEIYENVELDVIENKNEDVISENIDNNILVENKKKSKYGVLKSSKQVLANAIYISLQTHEFAKKKNISKNIVIEEPKINEEFEFDIDAKMAALDLNDENINDNEYNIDELIKKVDQIEEAQKTIKKYEEKKENNVFDLYFNEQNEDTKKRKARDEKKLKQDLGKSKGIFNKIISINSKKRREA